MKNIVSLICLILISQSNISCKSKYKITELTCSDFETGKFYIPNNQDYNNYEIISNESISEISIKNDSSISKYTVIRSKNSQIEWINGIGNGEPTHEIIDWIDDCTYRLTFDSSKTKLDDEKKWINDNNGIVVSKIKIKGKCMFYNSSMTTNEGEKISGKGIICIE